MTAVAHQLAREPLRCGISAKSAMALDIAGIRGDFPILAERIQLDRGDAGKRSANPGLQSG